MHKLLAAAVVAAAALAAALPAAAISPTVRESQFAWSGVDTYTCGVPIANEGSVSITTRTFFDSSGTAIRTQDRSRAVGSYTSASGRIVWFDQEMNSELDLLTHIQVVTGGTMRLTAPGAGVLLHDVGRMTLQTDVNPATLLSESGQHPTWPWDPHMYDAMCAYLLGP